MLNKRKLLTLIALTMLIVVAQTGYALTPIDIKKSQVLWLGTKVTGQHNGTIQLKSGEVDFTNKKVNSARFVFDMATIKVLDIEDPKWNKKLEGHLKDEDFFGVNNHPEAVFELSSASPIKGVQETAPNWRFVGDLTIKGITHAVSFDAFVDIQKNTARASGEIIVDRTKYGIKYKSGKFFDALGDKAIYDEFEITFDVVTN